MLVQSFRRGVADREAFATRTMFRGKDFSIAVLGGGEIAVDRGVLGPAVKFARRLRRPQISIVLEGVGYVDVDGRLVTLREGDVLATDQRRHRAEGYGGLRSSVIVLDWDESSPFETSLRCEGSVASLAAHDRTTLLEHVADVEHEPPERWVYELTRLLAAIGILARPLPDRRSLPASPRPLVVLYGALGTVLSRLDTHPSLDDVATMIGVSERQTKRLLAELTRGYAHSFTSWRDFLHETRLDWTAQLLSVPNLGIERASKLAGYRSSIALHHALSTRGGKTPGTIARELAERWR
jgi:AraC-like DNA-binding protein/mannose-6-phosphate isomerase-like protein (cupin superfamily)